MGFPCAMTRKVGKLSRRRRLLMAAIEGATLLAAVGGAIGAVRGIVVGWKSIRYFA